jgi:hypothetical protein
MNKPKNAECPKKRTGRKKKEKLKASTKERKK